MNQQGEQAVRPEPTQPRRKRPLRKTLCLTTQWVVGAGAVIVVVGSISTPCLGSTRSARLIWEARQRQTEREVGGNPIVDIEDARQELGRRDRANNGLDGTPTEGGT
jgi:hypothetical protein